MFKKILLASLIFVTFANAKQIVIATGGLKGNYYKVGKDINKKVYNGKAKVINTQGSVENMLLVAEGKADIALVQADALAMLETFYMSEGKSKDDLVEVVGTLYQETVHILVHDKSEIHSIEDLDGKTIVSGGKGSGTTLTASSLAQEYGISFGYNRNCSTTKGIKLLKRRKIDALFYVTKAPSARLKKYKIFRMIETVDEGDKNEYLKSVTIPKESYRFLNYDTRTYAVDTILIIRKDSREKPRIKEYLEMLGDSATINETQSSEPKEKETPTFSIDKEVVEKYAARYGNGALVRLNYLDRAIRGLQDKSTTKKLEKINKIVNKLSYSSDRRHWKAENYWATPLETLGTTYADTEDMALLKFIFLVKAGINPKNLQLIQKKTPFKYKAEESNENIALLYIGKDLKTPVVLDNTTVKKSLYSYDNQYKYKVLKKAQNPLWDKLFDNKISNEEIDTIMNVLGIKR